MQAVARILGLCGLLLILFTGASAQPAIPPLAPSGAPANGFPAPDRPVAGIISPIWATEDERRSASETNQVFRLLGIRPGMSVADIGAGSGYYTMQLSRAVGANGRVFAQDVMPDYLVTLQARVLKEKLTNVTVSLGEAHDPRLPPRALDAAVLIHMYHEIEQPYALLFNLAASMKPGAKIGIVDLNRPTLQHGTPPDLLRCELTSVGYRETGFHHLTGDVGYLAIFETPQVAVQPSSITSCKTRS
jgi:SAM-dependent methyltransferase